MATRIWINEITFSDNSTLQFEKDDIIVLVGPNNAGKSASLKEAASLLKSKNNQVKVLKDLKIEKELTSEVKKGLTVEELATFYKVVSHIKEKAIHLNV